MSTSRIPIDLPDFVVVRTDYAAGEDETFNLEMPPLPEDHIPETVSRYVNGAYQPSSLMRDLGVKVRRSNYYFVVSGEVEYTWSNLETGSSGSLGKLGGSVTGAEDENGHVWFPVTCGMYRKYHTDSTLVCWIPKEQHEPYVFRTYQLYEDTPVNHTHGMFYCVSGSFTIGEKSVEVDQFTLATPGTLSGSGIVTWFGKENGD
jgi:hypothetical protein